ncbi:MAG: low molecular weight phosphotyrosine protein phosphatase [Flavobacteriales bacterium]|nr:low molecular weight phosphotyrosine protein phosphatase [Flavobacteriales bacterium]
MKILTVCLGNICRSPMAEGVLRHRARERGITIVTDSAGTGDYHVGEAPDKRAIAAMRRQGIDISDLRARQFSVEDYQRFDLIVTMDASNTRNVLRLAPDQTLARKVKPILDYAPHLPHREVPDPYYGGEEGFDEVYDMLVEACDAVLDEVEGPAYRR